VNDVAGTKLPLEVAACHVERVDEAVAAAEIDGVAADHGTRQEHVERVGDRLRLGCMPCRPFASNRRSPAVANFQRSAPVRASSA
jgi:hypothetical protein